MGTKENVSTLIERDYIDRIHQFSIREERSITWIINKALKEFFEKHEQTPVRE